MNLEKFKSELKSAVYEKYWTVDLLYDYAIRLRSPYVPFRYCPITAVACKNENTYTSPDNAMVIGIEILKLDFDPDILIKAADLRVIDLYELHKVSEEIREWMFDEFKINSLRNRL